MPPGEPNLPLRKPLSLKQRKILLRKRSNIPPSRRSIPPGKRDISSFKNAQGFSIDRAAFTDVAGHISKSVTGFVMEGASDVHIQNVNMGNQDIQDGSDAVIREHRDELGITGTLPEQSQASCDIYARLLLPKKHGYPLWLQDPDAGLPSAYRSVGVNIGDVGTITDDGGFDFFFNICCDVNDPVNQWLGVPDGFVPLTLKDEDIRTRPERHLKETHIFGGYGLTHKGQVRDEEYGPAPGGPARFCSGLEFKCSGSTGALLVLPEGGSRVDLRNRERFLQYAAQNGIAWYQFINGFHGRRVENGSLYLVTGCDKSPAWGVASYSHLSSDTPLSLKFMKVRAGEDGTSPHEWGPNPVDSYTGPQQSVSSIVSDPTHNQCAFIRGYRISLQPRLISTLLGIKVKVEDGVNPQFETKGDIFPTLQGLTTYPPFLSFIHRGISQYGKQHSERKMNGADEHNILLEHISDVSNPYHPLVSINNYLLQVVEGSKIAITHDDDWYALLNESDSEVPEEAELIRRLPMEKIRKNGDTVYLELDEGGSVLSPLGASDITSDGDDTPPSTIGDDSAVESSSTSARSRVGDNSAVPLTTSQDSTVTQLPQGMSSFKTRNFRATVGSMAMVEAAKKRRKQRNAPLFDCEIPGCGRNFTARHNLRYHMKSHNDIRDEICHDCGSGFLTRAVRRRHQKTCTGTKQSRLQV